MDFIVMEKLRHGEVKQLSQDCTAKWKSKDVNPVAAG